LLLLDLDHLDDIRQQRGPTVGDAFLLRTARVIEECLREQQRGAFLARCESGVFAAIVAGQPDQARQVAEHLRRHIGSSLWAHRNDAGEALLSTTASIGMTPYGAGDSVTRIVERVEEALRQAKEGGRNKVVSLSP
jgi:diguanylate cyclase (GGDEF)-like protein